MGRLVDGIWQKEDSAAADGRFVRDTAGFRNWITPDGAPGPSGTGGFAAESGRYHLYVSLACPWAHRTLIFRELKGLAPHIGVSVVHPEMLENGWTFATNFPGATGDRIGGRACLHQLYAAAKPGVSGKVTVPVLFDTRTARIVSNESAEIIRMFNSAFDGITGNCRDFWPADLRDEIEPVNARVYETLNNGVYKTGFATTQEAYDEAVGPLFETLDWLEARLARRRYLMGPRLTEADWRLFTTLMRFDSVYHCHFKCNRARIVDYPHLWGYARELYQWPGIAATVRFDHIMRHYYYSHASINPYRIVPVRPDLALDAPHGRDQLRVA
ncbi:MAG: glutathione S-transferase family protein [Rhodobacteraceae bacterium]|nr:glutathione S-transferase family protein [Paracoccaceae bacterium]